MRRGSKFNELTIGDVIAPRKHPDNLYRVISFGFVDPEVPVTLECELSGERITRDFSQLVKNWRRMA